MYVRGRQLSGFGAVNFPQATKDAAKAANADLWVRMENGDQTAYLAALRSGTPVLHDYAKALIADQTGWPNGMHVAPASGWSADGKEIGLAFIGQLSPEEYQDVYGVPLSGEPWWRDGRINAVLRPLFVPGWGSYGRVEANGDIQVGPTKDGRFILAGNAFDPSLDLAALHELVLRESAAASSTHQIEVGPVTATAPVEDKPAIVAGPPSGWVRGSDNNGRAGWWGPDGLFYLGEEPWKSGVPGVKIETMAPPPPPPATVDPVGPAPVPEVSSSPPVVYAAPPTVPGTGPGPTLGPGSIQFGPEEGYPVSPAPPVLQEASLMPSGKTLAIGAALVAAYFLFGRKGR